VNDLARKAPEFCPIEKTMPDRECPSFSDSNAASAQAYNVVSSDPRSGRDKILCSVDSERFPKLSVQLLERFMFLIGHIDHDVHRLSCHDRQPFAFDIPVRFPQVQVGYSGVRLY